MLGNRQTDTHDNYRNPRCVCATRVNKYVLTYSVRNCCCKVSFVLFIQRILLLISPPFASSLTVQLSLYSVMLRDRYSDASVPGGLLYYMKAGHMHGLPAEDHDIRSKYVGLVVHR